MPILPLPLLQSLGLANLASQACDGVLARIKSAMKHVLETLTEDACDQEDDQHIAHLLHYSGGKDLDLHGLSLATATPHAGGRLDSESMSDACLLASADLTSDPAAFVQQLSYTPTLAVVRGPPRRSPYHRTAASLATVSGNSADEPSSDSSSGCSTPRASTPVADTASQS